MKQVIQGSYLSDCKDAMVGCKYQPVSIEQETHEMNEQINKIT